MRIRVLVVDDDRTAAEALGRLLREDGFVTSVMHDGQAALDEARLTHPDVLLTDLQMPGLDGVELCRRLHATEPELPVIVMTAHSGIDSAIESLRAGAEDYLAKPLEYERVRWCIERAVARRAETRERARLQRELNEQLVLSSIREQEHADAEAKHREQLSALLENLTEGVIIAEQNGRLLMINDAARAILGVVNEDLRTVDALQAGEAFDLKASSLRDEQRPLTRALRGEYFTDYEVLYAQPDGERRCVASTGTSIRGDDGSIAAAIVVFRDVTELRSLERQREEYLALISHDLRDPLGAIMSCTFMLRQSLEKMGLTREANLAERAERNVSRMGSMLDELTELTTLESRGAELRRVASDLREIVANSVERIDDARARRITIEARDTRPMVVFADPSLERVVANLLTNALKYSADDAPVLVRLARMGDTVELEVVDRGIGIAPESARMLFDRYYRTKPGKERARGLGLGLYIARLIVEAHGGHIHVDSEVGKGSTFRLTMPSWVS